MKTEVEVICALIKLLSQVNRHEQLGLLKIRIEEGDRRQETGDRRKITYGFAPPSNA
ncbi:MAG: hypothetical protein F6K18_13680 [Okeania sp. SIO2C2]|uniref:hypothetical protein n=1 Tax=Okeania sp. SIO2C2 TaxID=2607787 RepID=UPI0013BB6B28|nr:hypothetical protein [Okeania sp. SIO2C2]NEP87782.1 hypothetical protein [Okeania sp. SIO2C2]